MLLTRIKAASCSTVVREVWVKLEVSCDRGQLSLPDEIFAGANAGAGCWTKSGVCGTLSSLVLAECQLFSFHLYLPYPRLPAFNSARFAGGETYFLEIKPIMAEIVNSVKNLDLLRLLNQFSGAVILLDESSKIVNFNPEATKLFGLDGEELQGNFWAGLDAQLTLIQWRKRWLELDEEGIITYDTDIATGSDYLRPVRARVARLTKELALVEITDLISTRAAGLQLEAISEVSRSGYFFYNRINKTYILSRVGKDLLGIEELPDRQGVIDYLKKNLPETEWERFSETATDILQNSRKFHFPLRIENEQGNVYLEVAGESYGNPLHVTHIAGSIRLTQEQTVSTDSQSITGELARFSLEEARDMIFWTKPDGRFHYVNQSAALRVGHPKSKLEGSHVTLIAPYFNDEFKRAFWEQLRSEKSFTAEYDLISSTGRAIPISAVINYLRFGDDEYACSFCRDISVKKQRDTTIELSRAALDFASDYIIWLEEDLTIQYLNRSMLELAGGRLEEWTGQHYSKLFNEISPEKLTPGTNFEYTLTDRAGRLHYLDLRCDLLSHQTTRYLALVGRDVTERQKKQEKLEAALGQIKDLRDRLQQENVTLKEDLHTNYNVNNIITVSPKYRKVLQKVSQVADVNTTVLITGETGTGKELLARAIHQMSDRMDDPLVKVNCAALPESLIESELFGHEKGAFTGAIGRKKGRFEMADGGTLFLDEVGEMPLDLQAKLLRVLQEDEFERLGGTQTIKVDVRLIAATNRNLEKMVEKGRFRADLYYRLNVFPIVNPPLRKRPEDVEVLVQYFVRKFAKRQGKTIKEINAADIENLKSYDFPGNIRELENIVERAVVLCNSEILNIPLAKRKKKLVADAGFLSFEDMQRKHIISALKQTSGRITGPQGAGQLLDLNDRTLMSKMRKLNIHKREYLL